jgi:predicted nucleic acid-binding protein
MGKKIIEERFDALIFIDTNILLDFYRIRRSDISLKYLDEIESHKEIIITSGQVEMEYKKNRQSAILESIRELKNLQKPKLDVPTIISDAKAVEMIEKSSKDIKKQQDRLRSRIEGILRSPSRNDPVYRALQKVFKSKTLINLHINNKQYDSIYNLAKERFTQGYPPRKKSDTSIGDAINWEWIVNCAERTGKHIIIVTRDSDFGTFHNGEAYINDWLNQEFKERINKKRKLILTDKLSTAFKLVDIPVTEEMVKAEESILDMTEFFSSIRRFSDDYRSLTKNFNYDLTPNPFRDIYEQNNIPQPDFLNYWTFPLDDNSKQQD